MPPKWLLCLLYGYYGCSLLCALGALVHLQTFKGEPSAEFQVLFALGFLYGFYGQFVLVGIFGLWSSWHAYATLRMSRWFCLTLLGCNCYIICWAVNVCVTAKIVPIQ